MNVLKEYYPLYTEDYFIADLWGGRAGARSYAMSQRALYNLLHKENSRAFFLRQTHATIYTSCWQDLKDRIVEYETQHGVSLNGVISYSDNKSGENYAENLINGNTIGTKGFKVSSGNQTASLKSLAGATDLYIEEYDEVEKEDFNKLLLSLRKKGAVLQILRAFNPPEKDHHVWGDYKLTKVSNDVLVEIVLKHTNKSREEVEQIVKLNNKPYYLAVPKRKNHLSLQNTFINNYENLNETAIEQYEKFLEDDFHYFCTTILGLIPDKGGHSVYNDYDDIENHTDRMVQPNDVLHIGMDFNVTNMSAIIHVHEGENDYAVAELTGIFDTFSMCEKIKELYRSHSIVIYPDASGQNRKTSGKSDFDIIRQYKYVIRTGVSNPAVRDRVNEVNTAFRERKYFVNRFNCPVYSESLKKQKYKNGEPDKKEGYDHTNDAGGYYITKKGKTIKISSGGANTRG
ncbi:phage terminase large subunit [Chryseobacterium rhizosphaerae]|uniref:phage terminase large subunit n=1 Tax=Chryseobacterium rhizosphaerae TaxID=395937 RepID=UPI003D0BFBF1